MTDPSSVDRSIRRVREWLTSSPATNTDHAAAAGVDEKVVRQARQLGWNPRAATLRRLEALIPDGWRAGDPVPTDTAEPATSGEEEAA